MTERRPIGAILALCVTQIVGYGTLYCSFSILAPDMAAELGWSTEWTVGALSIALLIGGLTAPWLGRFLDRVGAGPVMTVGSAIAAAALVAWPLRRVSTGTLEIVHVSTVFGTAPEFITVALIGRINIWS